MKSEVFHARKRPRASVLEFGPLPDALQKALEQTKARIREQFKGITSDGQVVPGLFPVHRTGLSLEKTVRAAEALLDAFTPGERSVATFSIDDDAWRSWNNIHRFMLRHGVCLERLDQSKRDLALAMIRESMSAAGFEGARNVMKLNEHIGELTQRPEEYAEWYYWLSLMGTPSATEPWGWQLDGHHLIINCFILGDQLIMTPTFMGSEPCVAHFGKYAGTRVFDDEQNRGLSLMKSLNLAQRAKATIGTELFSEVIAGASRDNLVMPYEGIQYDELTTEQQDRLLDVIEIYIGRMRDGHAALKRDEIKRYLFDTWFGWIGAVDDESPFYYRIHSPVILIEFDHQPGIALDNEGPSRNHIHTLVRTPNGNDYGKDLLRQHYAQSDHSHPHTSHRLGLD